MNFFSVIFLGAHTSNWSLILCRIDPYWFKWKPKLSVRTQVRYTICLEKMFVHEKHLETPFL